MYKRPSAVASALLLTASAAAVAGFGGIAHAATTHHPAAGAAPTLTVGVTLTKQAPVLDMATVTPGKTMFSVTRGGSGGSVEVLRLKPGYSPQQAFKDFAKLFGKNNVPAVKRVDKNVVFYGGAESVKGGTAMFGIDLDKQGTYYVVNVDKGNVTQLTVSGATQTRSLPKTTGTLNWLPGNKFGSPTLPHSGWIKQTNHAKEPHFTEFQHVKKSTTKAQVKKYFASGAKGQPKWGLPQSAGSLIVSPGHTMVWNYHLPKGKYVVACFWPDKKTGMPHAFMGMWNLLEMK